MHLWKEFVKYTSLNVLGMLALSCYILADTFFVSQGLGTNGLTALNLAIPIYSFIHGSGLMIGMGGATKYTIFRSRGDIAAGHRSFTHAVYLAVCFAVFFVLLGLFLPGRIIGLFGAEGEVWEMGTVYLRVILLFAPAFLMNNVLLCFVRNDGAPQLSMAAMITGSLSNVVLDWVFIFPCRMGMFGAAFATGLAPLISMGVLSVHFLRRRQQFAFQFQRPRLRTAGGILSSGVPSLVTEVSSGIVMIVFNAIILGLEGNVGVAAYGVIANLSLVVLAMYTGIAQGVQPLFSRGHGRGDGKSLRSILRYALLTMLGLSALIYGVVALLAPQIAGAFNSEGNAALQSMAERGMRLYFLACPFAGFNVILSMFFTSTERPAPAHVISLLRGFVLIIPLALALSAVAGMTGVWCAFPVTELLCAAFGMVWLGGLMRRGR